MGHGAQPTTSFYKLETCRILKHKNEDYVRHFETVTSASRDQRQRWEPSGAEPTVGGQVSWWMFPM